MRKGIDSESERLSVIFNTLGDRSRLLILKLLMKHKNICVTDIANILKISVPAASYQFKILEMVGFVKKKRTGQMICYKIKDKDPMVRPVIKLLTDIKN